MGVLATDLLVGHAHCHDVLLTFGLGVFKHNGAMAASSLAAYKQPMPVCPSIIYKEFLLRH
jgi:hypothetical protein